MRIVFMGTPEISRKSLQRLYDEKHEIVGVFTGEDKRRGRGMTLSQSPVKELALSERTPVYHPADLTRETVSGLKPDIIAVVAFGKILRKEILDLPPLGCVNIHGSLLPKYRGAAPIQHAILNGERESGVTSMYMAEGIDDGDMIFMRKTAISSDETSGDLFSRLGDMGAELLAETISAIEQGTAPRIPQNHDEATYAPMLKKETAPIDFHSSMREIQCKVRAFIPWPVATIEHGGRTVKVYGAEATDFFCEVPSGTIISESERGIEIACSDGTVIITRLQAPGGKILSAADYLRGCRKV